MKTNQSTSTAEALSSMSYTGVDGVALDAVISRDATKLTDARERLLDARKSFSRDYPALPFAEFRIREAQIASAAQLLS